MPTVSFDKRELLRLIGKDMSDEELEYELAMLGVVPDDITDTEVVLDVTPNRPDFLSIEGLARGMRYFLGLESEIRVPVVYPSDYQARIEPETAKIRPYAVCAVVKDLEMDDELVRSLMQVQEKLHLTHSRNRKVASIGIYDLDKIEFPITYKVVDGSFSFVPLGMDREMSIEEIKKEHPKGVEYSHLVPGPNYVVWVDATGKVLSFPPVINSQDTAVDENTRNILIDVTGTRLQPVVQALNILVYALADRGGKIYSVNVEGKEYPDLTPVDMELDPDYVNKLLGLNLSDGEIASYLRRMGIGAKDHEGKVFVKVPAYRSDILHPIDLVEDVAIAYRYDRFEPEIPNIATVGEMSEETKVGKLLGQLLIGMGFLETSNYHLTSEDVLHKKMKRSTSVVRVKSAVNENYTVFRDMILPQLLDVLSRNKHHPYPQKLYEIGRVALVEEGKVEERLHLAGVIADKSSDYSVAKSTVEAVLRYLEKPVKLRFEEASNPSFLDGRVARILVNGEPVGWVGEIHPEVLENFEIEMPVTGFEIDLEFLGWRDW